LQNPHIIHDDIALHKSPVSSYIELKKTERDQRKLIGAVSGKASRFRSEVEKARRIE